MRAIDARGLAVACMVCICVICGCGRNAGNRVLIQPRTELSSILLSEALSVEDAKTAVRCPIQIVNRGKQVSITLEGTGCSCYGVYFNGEKLTGGEPFEIPSGETQLTIQAAMPTGETSKSYRARFNVPDSEGQTQSVDAECVLKIFNDIEVEPRTWSFQVAPEDVGKPQRETVTITHHFRQPDDENVEPHFPQLPDSLQIANLELTTPPAEIEPGLWRCQWTVELEVTVPADANPDDVPLPVQILIERKGQHHEAIAQLITRVKLPISYPRQMHLGRLYMGETKHRRMLVTSPEGAKYRLQLNEELDGVQVETDDELGSRHWLDVSATPTALGEFQRTATFGTDLQEQPEIQIQIVGVVVEPRSSKSNESPTE